MLGDSCARIPNKDVILSTVSKQGYSCDDQNVLWQGVQGLANFQYKHLGKPHRSVTSEHIGQFCKCSAPTSASRGSKFKGGERRLESIKDEGKLLRAPLYKNVEQSKETFEKIRDNLKGLPDSDEAIKYVDKGRTFLKGIDARKVKYLEKNIGQDLDKLQSKTSNGRYAHIGDKLTKVKAHLSEQNFGTASERLQNIHSRLGEAPKTEQEAITDIRKHLAAILIDLNIVKKADFKLSLCRECIVKAYKSLVETMPKSVTESDRFKKITGQMKSFIQK